MNSLDALTVEVRTTREEMNRRFGEVEKKLDGLDQDFKEVDSLRRVDLSEMRKEFVSKTEYEPVKLIVYGLAGAILVAFLALVIYYVGWRHGPA